MLEKQLFDPAKIVTPYSAIPRQSNAWIEPKFAFAIRRPHVYVSWLMSFVRVKVKPK
jgi:hypothetical protein